MCATSMNVLSKPVCEPVFVLSIPVCQPVFSILNFTVCF